MSDCYFQTSSSLLTSSWYGFHDPESGVSYYVISAGLWPSCSDIISPVNWGLSQSKIKHNIFNPLSITIYVLPA